VTSIGPAVSSPVVAVVTGASSGIGRAIAVAFGRQGTTVMLVGRSEEGLRATAALVVSAGGAALPHACDLADDAALTTLVRAVEAFAPGGLRMLVHSAGAHAMRTVDETTVADFDALYRVNVRAPFALTRALLPLLRMAGGDVVFVNTSSAITPGASVAAYAASKAALRAFADSLRHEVNPSGVRVLSVFPGRTATPLQRRLFELEGRSYDAEKLLQPDDVAAAIVSSVALPRTAELTELMIRPARKL
jgi:NAD(P)-dependent dehydrogenase (short-subunit alcohol dehydrogenase family)